MKILLQHIYAKQASRPEGYVEDVLAHGSVTGNYVEISSENLALLKAKYDPPPVHAPGHGCNGCNKVHE